MIYKYLLRIILLNLIIFPFTILSQDIGIGEWRDHLPYNNAVSVAASDQKIYCATIYSLFYLNKSDNSINRFTRISGLSDIGIVAIGFSKEYNTLMVAYGNTNIDLVKGNTIINMRDIINSNAVTPAEKTINSFMFIDNLAYISCGFGIVVLDIESEEITDTYYIGPNGSHLEVFELAYNDTSFFAATKSGIYYADIDNPNLAYFGAWSRDETVPYSTATYNHIAFNGEKLYINRSVEGYGKDTIIYYDNSQWNYDKEIFINNDVYSLKSYNGHLYVSYSSNIYIIDEDHEDITKIWSYYDGSPSPRELIVENNVLWIADYRRGLVRQNDIYDYTIIYPNGPETADVFDMSLEGNTLWTVNGGRDLSWGNLYKRPKASSFIDNEWNTTDNGDVPAFDTIGDLVCVAINPINKNQVYMGSWGAGVVMLNNNESETVYTPENSGLNYYGSSGLNICRVGGLAFDKSGNLWVTSAKGNHILSVKMVDGTWPSFNLGSSSSQMDIGQLIIDSYGQKWILTRVEHTIIVFNDNGTILDPTDDQTKVLSSAGGNGSIPGNKVFSIAEDNDGEVWIGTDEGIAVFYSPENVFSGYNFDAQRILIPRNDGTGLADILLEFETITVIAVDGANNKWIGTDRSGIFHLSPDGQKELHHFTEQNSPLFSNNITSIVINDETGEVFFGTAKGIISYKSTATGGGETNSDVYAYPNPVRPGYNGPIAVKGLVNNASFKITDISGSLIYSGRAEGGQAVWNGNNFDGRRAQSGVYLVFVSDDNGKEKLVTKILFIN